MGSCLSKKSTNAKPPNVILSQTDAINAAPQVEKKRVQEEPLKKEIFVIKHRKSHEIERKKEQENGDVVVVVKKDDEVVESGKNGKMGYNGAQVRTSSCTKEEVDAILIQCGRLSRSSSTGKAGLSGSSGSCENNNGGSSKGKRYCGSKRSFDFDNENGGEGRKGGDGSEENEGDGVAEERGNRYRNRNRSRTPSSPGKGRRRTPSREREQGQQQGRSGSRERGVNGSGRRVSRSPGRRSESPNSSSNGAGNSSGNGNSRPQKMVSVPATVTSLAMDKSTNSDGGEGVSATAIKRIQVKRNVGSGGDVAVGGTRAAASPRARSPARNVQNQQPMSLSRSNSRKNEQSPFRRNPLSDIDTNVVLEKMPVPGFKTSSNNVMSQALTQKLNGDNETKLSTNVNVVVTESLKPQGVGRTRSSRLSRDLDINPEDLTNANPSYTSLLLEDIQNFHQKNTAPVPTVTLPACVSKAHSILEALADLNSGTGSNLSSALSGNRRRSPLEDNHHSKEISTTGMRKFETKETFGKSQVVVANDDIMQPSFHKYVTVRRGTLEGSELEEQESSGSNSFVAGSQQQWVSSSSWEPTSADSTDRWTSRSNKEDEFNPLGFQRQAISDIGREVDDTRRRAVVKRKDGDLQQSGIGRGRVGPRGQYTTTQTAATASS